MSTNRFDINATSVKYDNLNNELNAQSMPKTEKIKLIKSDCFCFEQNAAKIPKVY